MVNVFLAATSVCGFKMIEITSMNDISAWQDCKVKPVKYKKWKSMPLPW